MGSPVALGRPDSEPLRARWTAPGHDMSRLASMLSDLDLLNMPLGDLTALARGVRD
jgi:hypothetical protein